MISVSFRQAHKGKPHNGFKEMSRGHDRVWGNYEWRALFEDLGSDGDCGVDRVGDDGHPRLWAVLSNRHAQIPHDACTDTNFQSCLHLP